MEQLIMDAAWLYPSLQKEEEKNGDVSLEKRLDYMMPPLMEWFSQNARKLPWRSNPLPYWVWISEIMLQQTRVEAVKPYFERFMQALPEIKDLARIEDEALMKLWEGLGYYSRATNLKKAAIVCVEQYEGKLPCEYKELLKLPGIGSYTAGAIASIAYGEMVPAVDGNVLRVISRLTASKADIMKQAVKKQMEQMLLECMKRNHPEPGQFNQALMELGAMVCVPNGAPHCEACPWSSLCLARKQGLIKEIPVKAKKKARRIEQMTVFIVEQEGLAALHKRPEQGLLAGLYELPNVAGHLTEEEARKLWESRLGASVEIKRLEDGKHVFSHVEWHMIGYQIVIKPSGNSCVREDEWLFVPKEQISKQFALPSAFRTWNRYLTR